MARDANNDGKFEVVGDSGGCTTGIIIRNGYVSAGTADERYKLTDGTR